MNDIFEANKTLFDVTRKLIAKVKSVTAENNSLKAQLNSAQSATSLTDEQKESAVGVIGGFDCYGVPFVLGKKTVGKTPDLVWATRLFNDPLTLTKNKYDPAISDGIGVIGEQHVDISEINDNTFSGEGLFGMTNTKVLQMLSVNGFENDFPAFYQCENYPVTQNLTGELEKDWYMPSIVETVEIAKNSIVIDKVFNLIGGDLIRGENYYSIADIISSSHWKGSISYPNNNQIGFYDYYIFQFEDFYYVRWFNTDFDAVKFDTYETNKHRPRKIYAIKQY